MRTKNAFIIIIGIIILSSCQKDIDDTKNVSCDNPLLELQHPKSNDYQGIMDKYVKIGFPGMSVLIQDDAGIWVGTSGYADIKNGIAFESCHVSKAASITKLMVGCLTMKLQEEGILDIDDPVSKYIDGKILDKIDHPNGMTLKNLMNHTTGIFDVIKSSAFYLSIINYPNRDWEPEELLEFVFGQERKLLDPDSSQYSNTNTLLLSMCINEAAGRPHAELLREKILDPLGMNDTYYQSREELPEITAQGYFDIHNNKQLANMSNYITGSGNGYGGIFSNVFDLLLFLDALYVEKTLLMQESLDEMMAVFLPYSSDPTGSKNSLCVSMQRKFTHMPYYGIGHSGKDLGYTAEMFYYPEADMKMIFFINYGTDAESYLKPEFYNFEDEIMEKMFE